MKIALVTPYFLPIVGGMETSAYELSRRLSKNNRVYVFTSGRGTVETWGKVKVFRLRSIDIQDLPFSLKIPYPIPVSLVSKLAKLDVDIIHARGHAFATTFEAALACQITHKPLVLSIHEIGIAYQDYLLMRGIRPIVDSTLVNYVFREADTVIASNDVTYTYASRFKPKRIIKIPQGVDFDKFKVSEEGEYVTFVSRLVPHKGGEIFIQAIPRVLRKIRNARFRVIGDGFQRSFLEKLTIDLGVRDSVEFVGSIPYPEVPKYLSQAKLIFSYFSGQVLLEAAAMRKPVITTRNRWAKDTLGSSPLFVSMRNPEETAKAIVHLLGNRDERERIAQLCYRKISPERSWDVIARKHLDLYSQIINRSD
ncbi:MAG: glycosyltransferase family 4 protein [Candidatus Bathyarchaeota archaeon]|nr:glycosyltransferase family 4 protein [Candidatus Bathyarchaeota archaeon]MDH5686677.1 glycosyltransferase family 4 protein [Candidatus Bathyarchaeota archaeon]